MTDWSLLLPPGDPPERVQKAVNDVRRARDAEAKLINAQEARKAVEDAEAADIQRMSAEARKGRVPASDLVSVEQARAQAAAVERRAEAIRSAEADLGDACQTSRGESLALVEKRQAEARGKARAILAELEGALGELAEANSAWAWLRPRAGMDRGRRPGVPMVAPAKSSARLTANGSALTVTQVVALLREAVADPAPPSEQPVQPLRRMPTTMPAQVPA
jgi:hypothetical protein